jgi:hypothetical protein
MIQCDKHGLQEIVFTSPFIQNLILNEKKVNEDIFPVKMYLEIFDRYVYFWSNLKFIRQLGVLCNTSPKYVLLDKLGEEKSFEMYNNTVPVCRICYEAFQQKNELSSPEKAYNAVVDL